MEARTPSDSRIAELIRSTEVISAMLTSEQIEAVLGDEGPEWPDLAPGTLAVGRAEFDRNLERARVPSPSIREEFFEDLGPEHAR